MSYSVRSRSCGRKPHLIWTLLAPSMPINTPSIRISSSPVRNPSFLKKDLHRRTCPPPAGQRPPCPSPIRCRHVSPARDRFAAHREGPPGPSRPPTPLSRARGAPPPPPFVPSSADRAAVFPRSATVPPSPAGAATLPRHASHRHHRRLAAPFRPPPTPASAAATSAAPARLASPPSSTGRPRPGHLLRRPRFARPVNNAPFQI